MKDDRTYLHHIVEAIEKIESYTAGFSEEAFLRDSLVQDGVIRQFEIIGEATKHLSPETRNLARMLMLQGATKAGANEEQK